MDSAERFNPRCGEGGKVWKKLYFGGKGWDFHTSRSTKIHHGFFSMAGKPVAVNSQQLETPKTSHSCLKNGTLGLPGGYFFGKSGNF